MAANCLLLGYKQGLLWTFFFYGKGNNFGCGELLLDSIKMSCLIFPSSVIYVCVSVIQPNKGSVQRFIELLKNKFQVVSKKVTAFELTRTDLHFQLVKCYFWNFCLMQTDSVKRKSFLWSFIRIKSHNCKGINTYSVDQLLA